MSELEEFTKTKREKAERLYSRLSYLAQREDASHNGLANAEEVVEAFCKLEYIAYVHLDYTGELLLGDDSVERLAWLGNNILKRIDDSQFTVCLRLLERVSVAVLLFSSRVAEVLGSPKPADEAVLQQPVSETQDP